MQRRHLFAIRPKQEEAKTWEPPRWYTIENTHLGSEAHSGAQTAQHARLAE